MPYKVFNLEHMIVTHLCKFIQFFSASSCFRNFLLKTLSLSNLECLFGNLFELPVLEGTLLDQSTFLRFIE